MARPRKDGQPPKSRKIKAEPGPIPPALQSLIDNAKEKPNADDPYLKGKLVTEPKKPLLGPDTDFPITTPNVGPELAEVSKVSPFAPSEERMLANPHPGYPDGPKNWDEIEAEEEQRQNSKIRSREPDEEEEPEDHSPSDDTESLHEEIAELRKVNQGLREQLETPALAPATPTALKEWTGKDVRILFPCYKTTNPLTALCIAAMALDYGGERLGIEMECGDAMIYHARNILADRFLATNATWSLWIDDDIIFPIGRPNIIRQYTGITPNQIPDAVLGVHTVNELIRLAEANNAKIMGGTYFGRRAISPAMFDGGINNEEEYQHAKRASGIVIPTAWTATGCLLVHRQVYEDIKTSDPTRAPNEAHKWWDFFRPCEDGRGEDVAFGRAAKFAGHQSYVATGVQCLHLGYQTYGSHNTTNRKPVVGTFDTPKPVVPANKPDWM